MTTVSLQPLVFRVDGFLLDEECRYIRAAAEPQMAPSQVSWGNALGRWSHAGVEAVLLSRGTVTRPGPSVPLKNRRKTRGLTSRGVERTIFYHISA
jgi:hypothetical protein